MVIRQGKSFIAAGMPSSNEKFLSKRSTFGKVPPALISRRRFSKCLASVRVFMPESLPSLDSKLKALLMVVRGYFFRYMFTSFCTLSKNAQLYKIFLPAFGRFPPR